MDMDGYGRDLSWWERDMWNRCVLSPDGKETYHHHNTIHHSDGWCDGGDR